MTRVLLAEDDALVREALTAMLAEGGHEVVAVASAVLTWNGAPPMVIR